MKIIFTICFVILMFASVVANNIQVSTVSLTGQVKASHYAAVQFNIEAGIIPGGM